MLIHNIDTFERLNLDKLSIIRKTPFDDNVISFLNSLSKAILQNKEAKIYPDLITFGFFCRKSNLLNAKSRYEEEISTRLGYGLSVHISPSTYQLILLLLSCLGCCQETLILSGCHLNHLLRMSYC